MECYIRLVKNANLAISYDCAFSIKAFAVLLMVFHHCFCFPSWYVDAPEFLDNGHLIRLAHAAKVCVPVFAFLTGWTYYHHKDKTIKYSFRKIITLLCDYWIIVLPISLFAFLFCQYHYSIKSLGELLPVFPHPLMIFAWYVWFYILMMAVFPLFSLVEKPIKTVWPHLSFAILICVVMFFARRSVVLHDLCVWFPCAICGYYIAKFRMLEFFLLFIKNKCMALLVSIFSLASALYIFSFDSYLQNGSFLHACTRYTTAPLFVLGIILFRQMLNINILWSSLGYIGKHSMNIWFVHCIFFSSESRNVVQNMACFADEPMWIYSIVVIFSLGVSILIYPIQSKLKHRLLLPLFR